MGGLQLLESRAKRPSRAGGASLSVALHTAIIGAIVAGTATGKSAPNPVTAVVHLVPFNEPAPPRPLVNRPPSANPVVARRDIVVVPPTIVAPTIVPTGLPAIDLTHAAAYDSVLVGSTPSAGHGSGIAAAFDLTAGDGGQGSEWTGRELLMRIVASRKPRYPESLRQAGIDGRVLVQFTVDTAGAIDMASVRILESTHELFTRSVRNVLASFRFRPAEVNGRRVPSLAEMPFEFSISK